jgi:protein farnesyltransferase/geranylgeranyltransferase type-1 subunit alpha
MAVDELTPRILDLTAHIIKLNPAHYTVWLYRASALFKLNSPLQVELEWLNEIALANQKNYQIWHHRQLIVEAIFPSLVTPAEQQEFAKSEVDFITIMFEEDSKNYHVWSYRQYLVRKMSLFPSQTASTPLPNELTSIETLVRNDVRNNSAWSHRFFVVFSDPNISTPGSKATEPDTAVPGAVIDREIEVAKSAIWRAPQNQSPWNYLRGVLRKGGRGVETLTCFAEEFVKFDEANDTEDVKSSHALDLLADIWTAKGERQQADKALRLLGEKYDPIRKNYWEWRRDSLAL